MIQVIGVALCLFLFAVSLSLFSKSAEQRARARTELFYAEQIREEIEEIRLQKDEMRLTTADRYEEPTSVESETTVVADVTDNTKRVELKELDLDEKAQEFLRNFQPKQEEIRLQEVTVYEEPKSWFRFPEVDLHMNLRPEKGLFYVAGKVIDVFDEMTAIISDGTGERLIRHHKVKNLSDGDIIISQVEIEKSVWNFLNVWEVNEADNYLVEKAM